MGDVNVHVQQAIDYLTNRLVHHPDVSLTDDDWIHANPAQYPRLYVGSAPHTNVYCSYSATSHELSMYTCQVLNTNEWIIVASTDHGKLKQTVQGIPKWIEVMEEIFQSNRWKPFLRPIEGQGQPMPAP